MTRFIASTSPQTLYFQHKFVGTHLDILLVREDQKAVSNNSLTHNHLITNKPLEGK
jgi:hypothetical protein